MKLALGFAIALALGAPLAANAADAYVVSDISLNAGPDTDYPPIDNLSAGTEVYVNGCIEGFSWCDVSAGPDRGWVPGSFLEEEYDDQPVYLIDYGPRIGIPVVSFNIGVYWDAHYRSRPFYGQRTEWVNRHIAVRSPPRPSIAHAPPIPNRGAGHHDNHAQPAHTAAAPRPAPAQQAEHRAPARDDRQQTSHDEMANRATRERTATPPKPKPAPPKPAPPKPEERAPRPTEHAAMPRPTEHAQPKPAEHAQPKPVEHAQPKPKEEPKKDDHKDDDHGH